MTTTSMIQSGSPTHLLMEMGWQNEVPTLNDHNQHDPAFTFCGEHISAYYLAKNAIWISLVQCLYFDIILDRCVFTFELNKFS